MNIHSNKVRDRPLAIFILTNNTNPNQNLLTERKML